jgi:hypothetical protein
MESINLKGDQSTGKSNNANCRHLKKLLLLTAIYIGFAISACDFRDVDASAESNSKRDNNMESIQNSTTIQNKMPPIDVAVPSEIKTATFAMG